MNQQDDLFTAQDKKLLNIATWSKYLAWVILVVYVLLMGLEVIEFQNMENYSAGFLNRPAQDLKTLLSENPLKAFNLGVDMAATLLRGIVYYLVLRGVSLGLNMIVETDINYREQVEEAR